jgi:hypothetical protein
MRDAWVTFANWESQRYFHDDPSNSSKQAIDWILRLNELYETVLNDYEGPGKQRCLEALESAFVAYSRIELPEELCKAIQVWHMERLQAQRTAQEDVTIGQDLFGS